MRFSSSFLFLVPLHLPLELSAGIRNVGVDEIEALELHSDEPTLVVMLRNAKTVSARAV